MDGSQLLGIGGVAQVVTASNNTYSSITAVIPMDDTIPQVSEGTQILSQSITPSSSTARIRVRATIHIGAPNLWIVSAIFHNNSTNAIDATMHYPGSSVVTIQTIVQEIIFVPGNTSAWTFSVRIGPGTAGTIYMNGNASTRLLGGQMRSYLVLEELTV